MIERVRQIPGVTVAGATTFAPFTDGEAEPRPFTIPGRPAPTSGEEPLVRMQPVSPGYLRALGVPLLAGEDVDAEGHRGKTNGWKASDLPWVQQ